MKKISSSEKYNIHQAARNVPFLHSPVSFMFFQLRSFDVITREQLLRFGGHRHSDREILIGLEGRIGVTLDEREWVVGPHELLLIPSGKEHWYFERKGKASYYNILFDTDMALPEYPGPYPVPEACLKKLIRHRWQDQGDFPEMMRLTLELLKNLPAHSQAEAKAFSDPRPRRSSDEKSFSRKLSQIIQAAPGKSHRLPELARLFDREASALTARAKKTTGFSLMDLYYRVKIEIALEELRRGESIAAVSEALGFADPFHFSKKFKKITGHSPSQYKSK